MKKFRASYIMNNIEEFEILNETEFQVSYRTKFQVLYEAKISSYISWHNTKEEAKEHMINKRKEEIKKHLSSIKNLEEKIKETEAL